MNTLLRIVIPASSCRTAPPSPGAAFEAEDSGSVAPLYPDRLPRMRVVTIRSDA